MSPKTAVVSAFSELSVVQTEIADLAAHVGAVATEHVEHVVQCGAARDHVAEVRIPVVPLDDGRDDVRGIEHAGVEPVLAQEIPVCGAERAGGE